jgi:PTH2 family peptidyl-tRNA hydrolase
LSYKVKQVIVVIKSLNMRKGKIAAQVAHASMKFLVDAIDRQTTERHPPQDIFNYFNEPEIEWLNGSFAKVVCYVETEGELLALIKKAEENNISVHDIVDAGMTEFHGVPTLTCAAFGPDYSEVLDLITGGLKLL